MRYAFKALCITAALAVAATAQTFDWIETAGSSAFNPGLISISGEGVDTDPDGNIYVVGTYHDTISIGSFALTCSSNADIFIAKYASDGTAQWAKSINNNKELKTGGIAVDASGNCYVVGNFNSTTSFNGTMVTSDQSGAGYVPSYGFYMMSLDTDGNNRWVQTSTGNQVNTFSSVAVNAAGDAAVLFGVPNATALTIGGQTVTEGGYVIAGLNTADGTLAWTSVDGSSMFPGASGGIAIDGSGNIAIAGNAGFIGITIGDSALPANKVYTAKYDDSGTLQWLRTGSTGTLNCVAFDAAGNVYSGGMSTAGAAFGAESVTANGGLLVKYGPSGDIAWLANPTSDGVISITGLAGIYDGVMAVGTFQIKAYFGTDEVTTNSPINSTFITAYDGSGTHSIIGAGQSTNEISATAAATGPAGELCVTGLFRVAIEFGGTSGLSTIGISSVPQFFVMRVDGTVGIYDTFVTTPDALPQFAADGYYDLSGRKVNGIPAQPGMYVTFPQGAAKKVMVVE